MPPLGSCGCVLHTPPVDGQDCRSSGVSQKLPCVGSTCVTCRLSCLYVFHFQPRVLLTREPLSAGQSVECLIVGMASHSKLNTLPSRQLSTFSPEKMPEAAWPASSLRDGSCPGLEMEIHPLCSSLLRDTGP